MLPAACGVITILRYPYFFLRPPSPSSSQRVSHFWSMFPIAYTDVVSGVAFHAEYKVKTVAVLDFIRLLCPAPVPDNISTYTLFSPSPPVGNIAAVSAKV